jgi:hypothetical protein
MRAKQLDMRLAASLTFTCALAGNWYGVQGFHNIIRYSGKQGSDQKESDARELS